MTEVNQNESSWVALISQERYDTLEISQKLAPIFEQKKINLQSKSVVVKPSFVFPINNKEHLLPINTNNTLVAAVCKVCVERGAKMVYIVESETILIARYSFDTVEIAKELKKLPKNIQKKIQLVPLDETYREKIAPERPFIPNFRMSYPKIVKDADVFISLPKLKCNMFAEITLSAKNNIGLIPRKERLMHHGPDLHELIADLWQIRPPDFIITDAILAGEGQGPQMATSHPTNLLLMSNNGLAIDSVSCKLMGFDPNNIRHLVLLQDHHYGTLDLTQIQIENVALINERIHQFRRPDIDLANLSPNIHFYGGQCCESGCKPFIRGILEAWGLVEGWDSMGELNIIIGKDLQLTPNQLKKLNKKRTIVYGNCVKQYKKYGYFYSGCPPDYLFAGGWIILNLRMKFPRWAKETSFPKFLKNFILSYLVRLTGKKFKQIP